MPSPDVTPYVDLTVHDKTVQDLVDDALADAQAKLPGWVPREGNTEVVLLEALALEVAELVYAINRLPDGITEVLLELYGLERDQGTAPAGDVQFTLADTAGHTIPAGTRLRLQLSAEEHLDLTTDAELTVAAGSATGVVAATGGTATSAANGTAAGTALELVDAIAYVETVQLDTQLSGGVDPETGAAFLDRGVQRLQRLVETLVLPKHFTAAALEDTRVHRATTVDNYDPATGPNPGDNPGHVTVAVADSAGAALAAATKDELDTAMEEKAAANLEVHVADPNTTAVDVSTTVVRLAGHTSADVQAAVEAALDGYLDPAGWPWAATVRRNELISLVDGVAGVDYVDALQLAEAGQPLGTADVALGGVAPLADAGTLTVTVNAP